MCYCEASRVIMSHLALVVCVWPFTPKYRVRYSVFHLPSHLQDAVIVGVRDDTLGWTIRCEICEHSINIAIWYITFPLFFEVINKWHFKGQKHPFNMPLIYQQKSQKSVILFQHTDNFFSVIKYLLTTLKCMWQNNFDCNVFFYFGDCNYASAVFTSIGNAWHNLTKYHLLFSS